MTLQRLSTGSDGMSRPQKIEEDHRGAPQCPVCREHFTHRTIFGYRCPSGCAGAMEPTVRRPSEAAPDVFETLRGSLFRLIGGTASRVDTTLFRATAFR